MGVIEEHCIDIDNADEQNGVADGQSETQDTKPSDMTPNTSIDQQNTTSNTSKEQPAKPEPKKQSGGGFLAKLKGVKEVKYTIDDILGLQSTEGYWDDKQVTKKILVSFLTQSD